MAIEFIPIQDKDTVSGPTVVSLTTRAIICVDESFISFLKDKAVLQQFGEILGATSTDPNLVNPAKEAMKQELARGAEALAVTPPIFLVCNDGLVFVWCLYGPENCGGCAQSHRSETTTMYLFFHESELDGQHPMLRELFRAHEGERQTLQVPLWICRRVLEAAAFLIDGHTRYIHLLIQQREMQSQKFLESLMSMLQAPNQESQDLGESLDAIMARAKTGNQPV